MSDQRDDQRTGRKPDSDSPEWWARDLCDCGHRFDQHAESASERWPCGACDCSDLTLETQSTLDIQNARE